MSKNSVNYTFVTPEFRMSFPNLVAPRPFMENGKQKGDPKYGVEAIFDPASIKRFRFFNPDTRTLEDAADLVPLLKQAAAEKWPGITIAEEFKVGANWPIQSGDTVAQKKAKGGEVPEDSPYVGNKIIKFSASEDYPPTLLKRENNRAVPISRTDAEAKSLFNGGNYAVAEVNVVPMDTAQGKFLVFYLNSIQFTRSGESFGRKSLLETYGAGLLDEVDDTASIEDDPLG